MKSISTMNRKNQKLEFKYETDEVDYEERNQPAPFFVNIFD